MTEETRASVCSPATQLGEHILKYKPIDFYLKVSSNQDWL